MQFPPYPPALRKLKLPNVWLTGNPFPTCLVSLNCGDQVPLEVPPRIKKLVLPDSTSPSRQPSIPTTHLTRLGYPRNDFLVPNTLTHLKIHSELLVAEPLTNLTHLTLYITSAEIKAFPPAITHLRITCDRIASTLPDFPSSLTRAPFAILTTSSPAITNAAFSRYVHVLSRTFSTNSAAYS